MLPKAKKFRQFDPRPPALRFTSQKSINDFLINCQMLLDESNWSSIPPYYEDYELSFERKMEIVQISAVFICNMKSNLESRFGQDPLTTAAGYHATGTIDQGTVMQIDLFCIL